MNAKNLGLLQPDYKISKKHNGDDKDPRHYHNIFVGREELINSFMKLIDGDACDCKVKVYYGVGGIGKSALLKNLQKKCNEKGKKGVFVDLAPLENRTPYKTLTLLAEQLKKHAVDFAAFDAACEIYLNRAYSGLSQKENDELSEYFGEIASAALDYMADIFAPAKIIKKSFQKFHEKYKTDNNIKRELLELSALEQGCIEERLSAFFAYDINHALSKNDNSFVVFIDTLEALWSNKLDDSGHADYLKKKDKWIEQLVLQFIDNNVLFVISSRETIKWSREKPEWDNVMQQHELPLLVDEEIKELVEQHASRRLYHNEITDSILSKIISCTEGYPFYINLLMDTFDAKQHIEINPTLHKKDLYERFIKYLDRQEEATIMMLSHARIYTEDIFKHIVEKMGTGYPFSCFDELNRFSFIKQLESDDKCFKMHDIMRNHLIASTDLQVKKNVNRYMFEFYEAELLKLSGAEDSRFIMKYNYLLEALYHLIHSSEDINNILSWIDEKEKYFDAHGRYDILDEALCYLLDTLNADDYHDTIKINKIKIKASMYRSFVGKHEEALKIINECIESLKGENQVNTEEMALALNRKGVIMRTMENKECEVYLCEALKLSDGIIIKEEYIAELHNSLGVHYYSCATKSRLNNESKYFDDAKKHIKEAIKIRQRIFGENHVKTSDSYNSMAVLCRKDGKLKDAVDYFQKAMKIRAEKLGKKSRAYAISQAGFGSLMLQMAEAEGVETKGSYLFLAEGSLLDSIDTLEKYYGFDVISLINYYRSIIKYYKMVSNIEKGDMYEARLKNLEYVKSEFEEIYEELSKSE